MLPISPYLSFMITDGICPGAFSYLDSIENKSSPLYNLGLPGGNGTAQWLFDVCPNTEATLPYSIVIIVAMCIYLVAFGIGEFDPIPIP